MRRSSLRAISRSHRAKVEAQEIAHEWEAGELQGHLDAPLVLAGDLALAQSKSRSPRDRARMGSGRARGDRERRDEIFEEWLSQLSEDERSAVELGSPPKKLRISYEMQARSLRAQGRRIGWQAPQGRSKE
jgi:hypothetical protein